MALNKNFDPIAGLFNNIEHIKPESSTDKTSKSTEAFDGTKEEKAGSVKDEKQETAKSSKDEKQETAKSSKDEKQETTKSSKD